MTIHVGFQIYIIQKITHVCQYNTCENTNSHFLVVYVVQRFYLMYCFNININIFLSSLDITERILKYTYTFLQC